MKHLFIIIIFILFLYLMLYFINHKLKYKHIIYENFEDNTIPKIIIQTWKTKVIPDKYNEDVLSVKKYNNDYQYLFFSDEDIVYFLKSNYPDYYQTYLKLPVIIQKIDFFRYIAIYHYGGFYFDLDMTSFYSLNELLNYNCVFPVDQNINAENANKPRLKKFYNAGLLAMLGQYAFGAKPQHPFLKRLIDSIHDNIENYIDLYKKYGKTLQYVYSTTGPDFVTNVYLNYNDKSDIHILDYNKDQYFGKYAKHNYYGTWKKKN